MFPSLLKIINFFLPSAAELSAETRLRSRAIVFSILIDLIYEIAFLLVGIWTQSNVTIALSLLVAAADCLCLYWARSRRAPLQEIFLYLIGFYLLLGVADTFYISKSWLGSATYYGSLNLLMGCILIRNMLIRFLILAFYLSITAICFFEAQNSGFPYPSGLPGSLFIDGVITILLLVYILIWIRVSLRIIALAQRELNHEVEWKLRSSRLAEIASMTSVMTSLMGRPLQSFKRHWHEWGRAGCRNGNAEVIEKVEQELNDLLQISQSFGWLYRAYRQDGEFRVSSRLLLRQLQVLLAHKAEISGWTLKAKPFLQNIEISGPVPSIMLLLFSLCIQVLESEQPLESRQLEIELSHDESSVAWKLSWPQESLNPVDRRKNAEIGRDAKKVDLREELIQDLKRVCQVTISSFEEADLHHILIQGAWRQNPVFAT